MTEVIMSNFAKDIMNQKYSHELASGLKETWPEISRRVSQNVLGSINCSQEIIDEVTTLISERKFMPGGRYLYAAGNEFHQTQNCLLLKAEDSREGWADLMQKATMALMTGAGIGIVYSDVRPEGSRIKKTGGFATGPIALMQMINEAGRYIMQGGSRRSAIWAGLHWSHADIMKFIRVKDWSPEVREMKDADYNFPATLDGTNVSVILDDEFFSAYHDKNHVQHSLAQNVYWETMRQMLKTAEPGFSIDIGVNAGEHLRNAPVCANTKVLTQEGYRNVIDIVDKSVSIWTGKQWATNVVFRKTNDKSPIVQVSFTGGREILCDETHPFLVEKYAGQGSRRKLVSIDRVPASELKKDDILHVSLPTPQKEVCLNSRLYTLGYIYGDGSFKGRSAEATFCTEASKRCVKIIQDSELTSSINMNDSRGFTRAYFSADNLWSGRSKSIFPIELYKESQNNIASFIAGLFDSDGNGDNSQKRFRLASVHKEFLDNVSRLLEQIGILSGVSKAGISTYGQSQGYQLVVMSSSTHLFNQIIPTQRVTLELEGYKSYRKSTLKIKGIKNQGFDKVFCADVKVPEHSFQAEGIIISNCTEVTSYDDSDICNLGSINMARVESLEEMKRIVYLSTLFLMAGTIYSHVPYKAVDEVRQKNRRLGLGVMGLHEWLLKRGCRYEPNAELESYLKIYATSTEVASEHAKRLGLSSPVKTRAIAPTGTIGIVAETTTGIEPVFCVAYKRRYLKGNVVNYQYVVDPTAVRLIESGIAPEKIEDAYSLAEDVERRVAFQAWVQTFVDHSISSTINLPSWGSEINNESKVRTFGEMFIRYLPKLRGITCYPDGARGGQPLTPIKYSTAIKHVGEVFIEQADVCDLTKGGSCGT